MGTIDRRHFIAGLGVAAALAAVRPAYAQSTRRKYRIGFLVQNSGKAARKMLLVALQKRGWREGENIVVEAAAAGSDPARWDAVARSLVSKHYDLIVVLGSHMALPMKRATRTIPLVMMMSGYPVEAGIVSSLAHPGGNITGLRTYTDELPGKYVELARELVPTLRTFGMFDDYAPPAFVAAELETAQRSRQRAATAMRIDLREWKIHDDAELTRALVESESAGLGVLLVTSGPVNSQSRNTRRIHDLLIRRKLPMLNDIPGRVFREAGGVMSYSASYNEIAARTASYVDRILKGADPADLPIEQPSRFELVLNQKMARAIGLTIPAPLLARADRVIE